MAFSSVISSGQDYLILGMTTGDPNAKAKGFLGNINSGGIFSHYKVIGDSVNETFGLFWNAMIETRNNQLAFTGYCIDSLRCLLFGLSDKNFDTIALYKYYTPQTYAFQGYSLMQYDDSIFYITGVRTPDSAFSNANLVLIKANVNGNRIWEKYYNQKKIDYAKKIVLLDNGNLLLGAVRSDANQTLERANTWLLELDTGGNFVREWFDLSDSTYAAEGLLQTHDGGYIYGAQKKNLQTVNDVYKVGTVCKLDSDFNKEWIFVDGSAGIETGIYDIELLPDGSYIACGNKPFHSSDSTIGGGWIVKLSPTGNVIWNKTYAGQTVPLTSNLLYDIDVLQDGSIIAVGQCQNLNQIPYQIGWFLRLDSNGCEIENCLVGLAKEEEVITNREMRIYPNPFTSDISINLTSSHLTATELTITNLTSQTVYYQAGDNLILSYSKVLDLSYLPSGVYFIEVTTTGGKQVEKIIKQ